MWEKRKRTDMAYKELTKNFIDDFRSISGNLAATQKKILDNTQKKIKKQTVAMRETA